MQNKVAYRVSNVGESSQHVANKEPPTSCVEDCFATLNVTVNGQKVPRRLRIESFGKNDTVYCMRNKTPHYGWLYRAAAD